MTKTIKNVAAVLRVSSAKQTHDDREDSVDKQRQAAEAWADAQGWNLLSVFDETAEKGYQSGAVAMNDRPYIQMMLAAAEAGEIDAVIFYSADRLGRNYKEAMQLCWALDAFGVVVGFAQDRKLRDPESSDDDLLQLIKQQGAQRDYKDLVEKMAHGKLQTAQAGRWIWGRSPTGYTVDRNTTQLTIDPQGAEVVEAVFEMIALGAGTTETAQALSTRFMGVRPKGISEILIRKCVRREIYIGKGIARTYQGEDFHYGATEDLRIVSDELWQAANDEMDGHHKRPHGTQKRTGNARFYPLAGRVEHKHDFASEDAYNMIGVTRVYRHKDGSLRKEQRVHHCIAARSRQGQFGKSDPERCQGFGAGSGAGRATSYSADGLEARVLLKALSVLDDPTELERIRQAFLAKTAKDAGISKAVAADPVKRMAAIDDRLAALERKQDAVIEDRQDGVITKEQRDATIQKIALERAVLATEHDALQAVEGAEDYWSNLILSLVARMTPFDTTRLITASEDGITEHGESSWTERAEGIKMDAEAVKAGLKADLDDESRRVCEALADLFSLTVVITDQATMAPEIVVTGNLPAVSETNAAGVAPSQLGSPAASLPFTWELAA